MSLLVLGNATVDLSYSVERWPSPGETVLASDRRVDAGGKGLNQAVVAHRAGASVRFVTAVGWDESAQIILDHLDREQLSADDLIRSDERTDESLIFIAADGENSIVSTADAARSITPENAASAISGHNAGDWLVLQGNLRRDTSATALRSARERGMHTFVNAAPITFDYDGLFPLIDVLVVNEIESAELSGAADQGRAGQKLRKLGSGAVVITLGGEGALLVDDDGKSHVAAPEVEVVDTTGAGDVICGVLVAGLSQGQRRRDALRNGVEAASLCVTRRGTGAAFPTSQELCALLRRTA